MFSYNQRIRNIFHLLCRCSFWKYLFIFEKSITLWILKTCLDLILYVILFLCSNELHWINFHLRSYSNNTIIRIIYWNKYIFTNNGSERSENFVGLGLCPGENFVGLRWATLSYALFNWIYHHSWKSRIGIHLQFKKISMFIYFYIRSWINIQTFLFASWIVRRLTSWFFNLYNIYNSIFRSWVF